MRKIMLTKGYYAIVDGADYEVLNSFKWYAEATNNLVYARRKWRDGGTIKSEFLHRRIMKPERGLVVDHINHDGLDNRRANLRVCTIADNCRNSRHTRGGTSVYKGVSWAKLSNKWNSQIKVMNKSINLGYFLEESEAALAYNKAARQHFGEFAHLNEIRG